MRFTMPSRLLTNLLLPGLEEHLDSRIVALSPLVPSDPHDPFAPPVFIISIASERRRLSVTLAADGLSGETLTKLSGFAGPLEKAVSLLLCIAFGMPATVRVLTAPAYAEPVASYIMDMSISDGACLRLVIPFDFFELFLPAQYRDEGPERIGEGIIEYFLATRTCFPRIGPLIESLPPRELEALFHTLRGRLSAYQVLLLFRAFPEYEDRLCASLPDALVREAHDLAAVRRLRITRRDLAGGVYSVDEELHRLALSAEAPGVFAPMRGIRAVILDLRLARSLPDGDFWSLCESSGRDGSLYEALGLCGERTAGIALAGAPPSCIEALRTCVSGRTVEALVNPAGGTASATELSGSRVRFASAVRKARVRRFASGRTDISFLLSRLAETRDYDALLVDAGWFLIATALKGVGTGTRRRLLAGVVPPARCLIEDVLAGTINPDILHDELQVRRAGEELSARVLALYERGAIRFSG